MTKDINMKAENDLFPLHKDVAAEDSVAWLFWQDPTFIGFAKIYKDRLEMQPGGPEPLDFVLLRDFRLFGPKGEWHVWRVSAEKLKGRFREAGQDNGQDFLKAPHLLWGTRIEQETIDDWTCVSEERGMRLWLPWKVKEDQPGSLQVRQIIGRDEETGLAGIIDAMLLMPE
jgi:CRISPR-associated protein (TIGR03984 family)